MYSWIPINCLARLRTQLRTKSFYPSNLSALAVFLHSSRCCCWSSLFFEHCRYVFGHLWCVVRFLGFLPLSTKQTCERLLFLTTFWFKIPLTALSVVSFGGLGPWTWTCTPSVGNISPGSLLLLTQSDLEQRLVLKTRQSVQKQIYLIRWFTLTDTITNTQILQQSFSAITFHRELSWRIYSLTDNSPVSLHDADTQLVDSYLFEFSVPGSMATPLLAPLK